MAYQTRDAVKCPIFGAPKPLPENQLPTYLDVMKAFLYERPILKLERKNAKLPLREIADEVAQKVEAIWRKGSIPTVSHTQIVQLLLTYHDKNYSSLLENITSRGKQKNFQSKIKDLVNIAQVTLFHISACKCADLENCSCDKSRKVPIKERNFLKDHKNKRALFIGKLDQKETARLTKNIKRKEIKKQRAIQAAQKTSFDGNASLSNDNEEEMDHLENDDPSYKAYRNSEAEASQSTSKNAPSSQMRKGLKLFVQTCDRFQLLNRAASALSSALLRDFENVTPKKMQLLIDKSKVRRERSKQRRVLQSSDCALASQSMQGLYFDSRKDKTLIQVTERDGRLHQ